MLRHLLAVFVLLATALPARADLVIFQSRLSGQYLAFDRQNLLAAVAPGPRAQPFQMIPLEGNRVAFRDPASGRFLRAGVGPGTHLALGEGHIRAWETFELTRLGGGEVRLRSVQSGAFVGYDGTGPLNARWATAGAGQTFRMAPVSLPVAAPPPAPDRAPPPPAGRWATPSDLWFAGLWSIDQIFDANGHPHRFNDRILREMRLQIDRQGRVSGQSACNGFTAQVVERGGRNRVEQFLTHRVGCVPVRSEIERAFYSALTSMDSVVGAAARPIELRDANDRIRLRLVPRR